MVKLKCTLGSGREAAEGDGGQPSPSSPPPPSGCLRMLGVGLSVPRGLGPEWPGAPGSCSSKPTRAQVRGERGRERERLTPRPGGWFGALAGVQSLQAQTPLPSGTGAEMSSPWACPRSPHPFLGAIRSFWRAGTCLARLEEAWRLHAQPRSPPKPLHTG